MTTNSLGTSAFLFTAVATAVTLGAGMANASDWEVDPAHSTATFSVRHMMVSTVRGDFGKVQGTLSLDDAVPAKSSVEIAIDAATINTGNTQRDGHLKSPDFFDVANNPKLTFKSTKIAAAGKGKFKVTGDLTMRGVTKSVTLDVEGPSVAVKDPMGRQVRGVSAKGKLNRKDWGLNWNKALEAGGVLVSDEVQIQVDAELTQKPATTASSGAAAKGLAK